MSLRAPGRVLSSARELDEYIVLSVLTCPPHCREPVQSCTTARSYATLT